MNKKDKIELIKNIAAGRVSAVDAKKSLAIASGNYQILVGLDLVDFEARNFDNNILINVNGKAAKVLSEKIKTPVEEIYV